MQLRTRIVAVTSFAVVALGVARYATFDPAAWADGVADRLSPFSGATLGAMKALAHAASAASAATAIEKLDAEELDARQARWAETMKAMRVRFHSGDGACVRYGALAPPARDVVHDAAEAIVAAGFARQLDGLVADAIRWRMEEDDRLHAADAASEALAFFSVEAGPWERVGVWMHRGDARDALQTRLAPHLAERHVEPESEARARAITARFGPYVTGAALEVSKGMRNVDLAADRLRYVAPGMSEHDVELRLGRPDERSGASSIWRNPATEVLFDDARVASAVSCTLPKSAFEASLVVGDETIVALDAGSIERRLGPPAWKSGGPHEQEIVWNAGTHRRRLVFEDDRLVRVELWKPDLLEPR